jgi:multidrug efflux system membrane fusion protein
VGGALTDVHFKEGQTLREGDPLFTIDPRPYQIAIRQMEANLARDTATAKKARVDANRYETLFKKGAASQEEYDTSQAVADALEATVQGDAAVLDNAKLQLTYCFIKAPMNAVAGKILIDRGSQIKANDLAMVVLNQIQPINVSFTVPQQHLDEIRKYQALAPLKIVVQVPGQKWTETGSLTFIDNTVDVATGTIRLMGAFSNEDKRLWPGLFVNVTLVLTTQPDSTVIPSQAIQTGQQGQYVFVVKPGNTVELRYITTGMEVHGSTSVTSGLAPGETIVTDGQVRLINGSAVEIVREIKPAPLMRSTTAAASQTSTEPATAPEGSK